MNASACPTDEQLSEYLSGASGAIGASGASDAAARAQIGLHLDDCEDCRQLVVAAVRAGRSLANEGANGEAPGEAPGEANDADMAQGSSPMHPALQLGALAAGRGAQRQSTTRAATPGALAAEANAEAKLADALSPTPAALAATPGPGSAASSVATPAVGVGSRLGRYVLTELLGVGGMGQVYRARDQELDRDVAVKVLRPGIAGSAEMLTARLLRESRLMARLSHPSVVAVYDVGRQGSLVFVAMELIDGTTLSAWLRGARSVPEILTAFLSAGRGLLAAHQAGLIHRDFKPDNVLVSLDAQGQLARVVVTDLGVARATAPGTGSLPPSSSPASSSPPPAYAPPPQTLPPDGGAPPLSSSDADAMAVAATSIDARAAALELPPPALAPLIAAPSPAPVAAAIAPSALPAAAARRSESARGLPLHDLHEGLTIPGATVGTPAYMAPEQLEGRAVDQRADVFAFAASLWEALWTSRPFPGRSLAEIAAAMSHPPVRGAPRGRVPRRVVAALDAALTIETDRRTPSLQPLLTALERSAAPATTARRRAAALLTAIGLLAAAVVLFAVTRQAAAPDPCAAQLAEVEAAFAPAQLTALRDALGGDAAAARTTDGLAQLAERWKREQRRLCRAEASGLTRPCLSARRTELLGVRSDLLEDSALRPCAERYINHVADPAACERPSAGSLLSRIPVELELRPRVRKLRARLDAAEQLRDRGAIEASLVEFRKLSADAERVWPPLHAETLYAEGATESQSGDSLRGVATLKQAAAIAEKARHDSIVAASWTQLVASAAFTDNDVERALEYADYADAALDRIGRPPADEALLLYYQGAALVQADRPQDGEAKLRHALDIAERFVPNRVPLVVQGLGFLYDHGGEHAKAIEMYRKAIAISEQPAGELAMYRAQLGRNLSMIGEREEALRQTTQAIADATGHLDPRNDDWTSLDASYLLSLRQLGRSADALAAMPKALARATTLSGERGAVTAIFRQLEAVLLADIGKVDLALARILPVCEAIAFTTDDGSLDYAGCLSDLSIIELRAGKLDDAHRHAAAAIALLEGNLRATAESAQVYQVRGEAARRSGDLERAAADFDRAIAICTASSADRSFLASAHIARARLTAMTDPEAAVAQLRQSIAVLAPSPGIWAHDLREAEKLLARLSK